ncbi:MULTISPECIES: hypothetical protein [unclassified Alteromonas]|uniref:hypothetical protein n=1 Tax=unclassified Alteromonas TaxID=2614992 RepID=UPI000509B3E5|nr:MULTISPECIES: hypothetical protein [unclassified Alteromonas]
MNYQTNKNHADTRKPLPKLDITVHLASDGWRQSIIDLAGPENADNSQLLAALDLQASVVSDIKKIVTMRNHQSSDITQGMHLKQVASSYDKLMSTYDAREKSATASLKKLTANIQKDFESQLGFSSQQNEEIRTLFRSKSQEQQIGDIQTAIESGDGILLNAILNTNPYAVGLTAKQQAAYRAQAMKRHTPGLVKMQAAIDKTLNLLSNVTAGLVESGDSITARSIREGYQRQEEIARQAAAGANF